MDDEPTGAADEDATAAADEVDASDAAVVPIEDAGQPDPGTADASDGSVAVEVVEGESGLPPADEEASPADEIIELPWDDDLPVALGEDTDSNGRDDTGADGGLADEVDAGGVPVDDGSGHDGDEGGDGDDDADRTDEYFARRRHESRRSLDSWRTRSATGAIASAIAMGLQQVFEPEKRRPAAVAEAPSDPYSDDDPVTVEYVPDDAEATTVRVKPWLLQKGDPE